MYITGVTDDVIKIFDGLKLLNDNGKVKFLIYIFGRLNNEQINSQNEINPSLIEDDDLKIFKFSNIGLDDRHCDLFLHYLISIYSIMNEKSKVLYDGNVRGIIYSNKEKKILSNFEKLSFNEKLDVFREVFIRYDNDTYFNERFTEITFSNNLSGYDIANRIEKLKI